MIIILRHKGRLPQATLTYGHPISDHKVAKSSCLTSDLTLLDLFVALKQFISTFYMEHCILLASRSPTIVSLLTHSLIFFFVFFEDFSSHIQSPDCSLLVISP